MKLQQLRYIVEIQRQGLNVSEAAESLYTSQPGISKQVKLLEDELGIAIFERSGKRFTGVTEPGKVVLEIAQRILREAESLKRASSEFAVGDTGRLVLAATHTQARYALPVVVRDFMAQHPDVKLEMHQGSPTQIAEWVQAGEAVLVDVRSDAEREWVGPVPGAVGPAWKQWPGMALNPAFDEGIRHAGADGRKLVLLCRSGVRSIAAAKRATELGLQAYNILEGFEGDPDAQAHRGRKGGWRFLGLPWRQN